MRSHVMHDIASGAMAGVVATWAMDQATTVLYKEEPLRARAREDQARGGDTAYAVVAQKVAGHPLAKAKRERYGTAIHQALGIGAGAVYGVLRRRLPLPPLARGLAFGAAVWLVLDEMLTPALGVTPGPAAFPWQTHARGLAGHAVFGATLDAALWCVDDGHAPRRTRR